MKTVVCLGASLTAGRISYNYLKLLEARPTLADFRFVNAGVDGDLAWNVLQRLDEVTKAQPDYVAILLGTNDANGLVSERNRIRYRTFNKLPVDPSLLWYEENLRAIVARLKKETSARLAFHSLAVIGEDLEHEANRQIRLHNEVIRRVCADEDIAYLPLYEKMVLYLRDNEGRRVNMPPQLPYRDGLTNVGTATALHANGMSWDEIAYRNGLLLTTDCLHLNSVGASMVADLTEGWLLEEQRQAAR